MAVSLAVAGPAALLAGGAWLNARFQLGQDLSFLRNGVAAELEVRRQDKCKRMNLFWVLEERAQDEQVAGRPFLVYDGVSWTYKETYDIVLKYGTWLKTKHAVKSGDVVAMIFMNSAQMIFLWLALWSLGARPAYINYNLTADPLIHSIRICGAQVVFVDEELRPRFTQDVMNKLAAHGTSLGTPVVVELLDGHVEQEILRTDGVREDDSAREGPSRLETASLIFTSGTTGLPKAVPVSWQKYWLGGLFVPRYLDISMRDRFYTCMPLYHSTPALFAFAPTLFTGSALVIGRKFSASTFWDEVRRNDATIIQYVGETCRYLLGVPPRIDSTTSANLDRVHNVRMAFGNGLRPDVWERFKERFGVETICEFYGQTEGTIGLSNLSRNKDSSGAVGRTGYLGSAFLGMTLAVVEVDWVTESPIRDPNNSNFCIRAKANSPGEFIAKIDPKNVKMTFQGYHNNPAATESKIIRDVFVKGDAYVRSGDLMRRDLEGRWWFCDRIGDNYRWKSENVSTTEVSEALGSHPNILEANVYGVEVPHHDGRIGCAAVALENSEPNDAMMEDVARHAKANLPPYAVPGFLRLVGQMAATGNLKQQKTGLRKEGVHPASVGEDRLFWLRDDKYVPFTEKEWIELNAGKARL